MEAFYVQLTTLLSLLCGNFMFGFAPLLIIRVASGLFCSEHFVYTKNRIITVFLVFGGGVFMSTSLLVLAPQTRRHYETFEGSHHSSGENTSHKESFPIPEFIVMCGFFATFAVEEVLHYILYHFHNGRTNNNDVRVRFCSCAKRHTECSRTFKADVPDQTLYGLEKKNTAIGLEYSEFTRPTEEATNMTTNLLMPQAGLPNYGTVAADERTNTPVNVLTPPPLITDNVVQQTNNTHPSSTHMASNIFLLVVLCCHAVLQGISIGIIPENSTGLEATTIGNNMQPVATSWSLLLILCLQQTLLSFVVGNLGLSTSLYFVVVMSIMSPAGISIAMLLNGPICNALAMCVVKALLCGSLLYFTFYDLLGRPSLKEAPHFSNFVGFTLGAASVAILLYASGTVWS